MAELLWAGGPTGIEGGELSHRAREACRPQEGPQVEVNGRAGDVMLAHPFMLHARSKNLGTKVLLSRKKCAPLSPPLSPLLPIESCFFRRKVVSLSTLLHIPPGHSSHSIPRHMLTFQS